MSRPDSRRVVALAGGVGGAKLAAGLAALFGERLTVVVNTGDDFRHLGLHVSPDLDTVTYTLAGLENPQTGWGLAGESWSFIGQVEHLGGPGWFRLGDKDLATHVVRSAALAEGKSLTAVTLRLASRLGVRSAILPMCDEQVSTMVSTAEGELPFQDYFVRLRCEPAVCGFRFPGIETARISEPVRAALADPDLFAIVLCPSNPFVSLDPILAVPGLREALRTCPAPVVAVSPIVGGRAVKGPAAKMMTELGVEVSAASVAVRYADLLDGLLIDAQDRALKDRLDREGLAVEVADTLMPDETGRRRVAEAVMALAERLPPNRR